MKDIVKIAALNDAELEKIANDTSIEVPAELNAKAENVLLAAQVRSKGEENSHNRSRVWLYAASLAAAVAIVLIIWKPRPQEPKDTFTDPSEAYACLEEVMAKVGSVTEGCAYITDRAREVTLASINGSFSIINAIVSRHESEALK